jgi:hypothetical protein
MPTYHLVEDPRNQLLLLGSYCNSLVIEMAHQIRWWVTTHSAHAGPKERFRVLMIRAIRPARPGFCQKINGPARPGFHKSCFGPARPGPDFLTGGPARPGFSKV